MVRPSVDAMKNAAGIPYGDLIRRQRTKKKMSQEQLGALAEVQKNAVGAWENGRSRPDLSSVVTLCEALELPVTEFLGVGDPIPESIWEFVVQFRSLNEIHQKMIMQEMEALRAMEEAANPRKLVALFRSDLNASAGTGESLEGTTGDTVWLYADPLTEKADEIIRVVGDSMEPTYRHGDEVLVQHADEIRPGEIGIFTNGDTGYIKEYRKKGLYSHNPAYPMIAFKEGDAVRCVGRVLGTVTRDRYATPAEIAAFKAQQD